MPIIDLVIFHTIFYIGHFIFLFIVYFKYNYLEMLISTLHSNKEIKVYNKSHFSKFQLQYYHPKHQFKRIEILL